MICGSATLDLPVPELVPCRLTPQLVSILEPFGASGLLSKSMTNFLEVLKKSKHILLACINIFVRDPIVEWFELAENSIDQNIINKKLRVDSVRNKLEGYNPKNITIMYLENGKVRQ